MCEKYNEGRMRHGAFINGGNDYESIEKKTGMHANILMIIAQMVAIYVIITLNRSSSFKRLMRKIVEGKWWKIM